MTTIRFLQSTYRRCQIRRKNAAIAAQTGPSLLLLPDDLLLMILDILYDADQETRGDFFRSSMVCKRLRLLASPRLFRTARIGARLRTKDSGQVPYKLPPASVSAHIRVLRINYWLQAFNENGPHVLSVARQLAAWIQTLPLLEDLSIIDPKALAMALETAFHQASVSLPNVTQLRLFYIPERIESHYPNLRVLSGHQFYIREDRELHFLSEAGKLHHLQHLSLNCALRAKLFEHLVECLPRLKVLSLHKGLGFSSLADILNILARLPQLEHLDLVSTGELETIMIHRDILSMSDTSMTTRLSQPTLSITLAEEHVTRMVFRTLASVKELTLGKWFSAERVPHEDTIVMRLVIRLDSKPTMPVTRHIRLSDALPLRWEG